MCKFLNISISHNQTHVKSSSLPKKFLYKPYTSDKKEKKKWPLDEVKS